GDREKWWTLRGLSLATTAMWMAAVISSKPQFAGWGPLLWFSLAYAGLYQSELIVSQLRAEARRVGVVFSLLVTALFAGAAMALFHTFPPALRGEWLVGIAAVGGFLSILFRRRASALAIGYRVQAAVLLLVAVPV